MSRRDWLWLVAAFCFAVINVLGAWYAVAVLGETIHGGVHVALLLPTAYVMWRVLGRRRVDQY
jgi:hypothetical protein